MRFALGVLSGSVVGSLFFAYLLHSHRVDVQRARDSVITVITAPGTKGAGRVVYYRMGDSVCVSGECFRIRNARDLYFANARP